MSSYDGHTEASLASRLALPRVVVKASTSSTLDDAHELAASGCSAGTLILAERQTAGRGRAGKSWSSDRHRGIWLTIVERPNDRDALDVLSLRLGVRAARALDRFAPERVQLKWPNDLYCAGGKLGGILVEARWRNARLEWVAAGVGINTAVPPDVEGAAALNADVSRVDVLGELVPALRAAAAARGRLSASELEVYAERDLARGRRCVEPARGVVRGLSTRGELLVETSGGEEAVRGGSLVFEDPI